MASIKKILITENKDFSSKAIELISDLAEVEAGDLDRIQLLDKVRDVDVLWLRLRHQIDKEVFDAASKLKYIVTPTTGLNHIDMEKAKARGIKVLSLRGEVEFLQNIRASAEHTMALMLAVLRNLPAASLSVDCGGWQRDPYKGRELYETRVGLLGFGRIGKLVARYLHAFGSEILAHDPKVEQDENFPYVQFVTREELLRTSDLVSLHVDLNPATVSFFGAEDFQLMKEGSYFINTSRGELLDEESLLRSLEQGKLAGAGLDVVWNEHQVEQGASHLITYAKHHSNVVITPHIAGCTEESMAKTEIFMARKLVQALEREV
ncbi:MAG: D-isomer specific 2-hydroxyacid dehydrogenase family protein [Desulfobulbaceae bacterium]|nr:D-isomer specific 2-hydroxyacid dehydrogenase family protein [Desulfobulbaceae bacterium]